MRGGRIVFILLAFLVPHIALAQISITTIVYDPPGADKGREWIGITNSGSEPVALVDLRLRTSAGVNHKITAFAGVAALAPGTSAAIVQDEAAFRADNPSFAGTLFRAAFSLTNEAGVVTLVDKSGALVATKSYTAPPKEAKAPASKKTVTAQAKTKAAPATAGKTASPSASAEKTDDKYAPVGVTPEALMAAASAGVAADAAAPSITVWALSALALAGFGGIATFGFRRAKSKEWDIEEIAEE